MQKRLQVSPLRRTIDLSCCGRDDSFLEQNEDGPRRWLGLVAEGQVDEGFFFEGVGLGGAGGGQAAAVRLTLSTARFSMR